MASGLDMIQILGKIIPHCTAIGIPVVNVHWWLQKAVQQAGDLQSHTPYA